MLGLPLAFAAPAALAALALLAALYLFLKVTPPRPREVVFPPLRLLIGLDRKDATPAKTPWPLLLLRIAVAGLVILAMAGPIWNALPGKGDGPLLIVRRRRLGGGAELGAPRRLCARRARSRRRAPGASSRSRRSRKAGSTSPRSTRRAAKIGCARSRLSPTRRSAWRRCRRSPHFLAANPQTPRSSGSPTESSSAAPTAFARALAEAARGHKLSVVLDKTTAIGVAGADNLAGALQAHLTRAGADARRAGIVRALDAQGRLIGEAPFDFGVARAVDAKFELPVELRNQISRLVVADESSAGATWLTDERSRRRRVAILSGASADVAQPLLSPTYYLKRALAPYAEIREARGLGGEPIEALLAEKPSVMALADMSVPPGPARDRLAEFVESGGVLLRFAGTRLAAGDDDLIPVGAAARRPHARRRAVVGDAQAHRRLRQGEPVLRPRRARRGDRVAPGAGRAGAGPRRQDLGAARRRHAAGHRRAARQGADRAVPRHRRHDLVEPAAVGPVRRHAAADRRARRAGAGRSERRRPQAATRRRARPTAPSTASARSARRRPTPRRSARISPARATRRHPPGFYGPAEALEAVNALRRAQRSSRPIIARPRRRRRRARRRRAARSQALAAAGRAASASLSTASPACGSAGRRASPGRPPRRCCVFGALAGAALDRAAGARRPTRRFPPATPTRRATPISPTSPPATRRSTRPRVSASTTLARVLGERTSAQIAEPIAVDPARDELSFYPLIYWPIVAGRPQPPSQAVARIAAFMKYGGTVVFDTRDALSQNPGGAPTPEGQWLRKLLAGVDVPELEPVPRDHVVTKTFYLIDRFVGRTEDGQTWIEALPPPDPNDRTPRPARAGDSVSPIIVTSNDLAAGWAADAEGRPLFPLMPGGPRQREMALRGGVNLVMYTLTGNYKADQVHAKDLLERLSH